MDELLPLERLDRLVKRQEEQYNRYYSDVLARDMKLADGIFEVERELRVRAATFDRSIALGHISVAVAKERYTALRVALSCLQDLKESQNDQKIP